jgi:RHS repeat-associated protein
VAKSTGTLYWGGSSKDALDESDAAGNLTSEYVFFNGKRCARRVVATGAIFYYFSDHLGSSNVITDASGNRQAESDFYPYGGEVVILADSTANHYKFTGKERDPETGVDYFFARYYSSALGRFLTPDWSATPVAVPYADFGDPQSLNLYAYVRNNPIAKADAEGHCGEDACILEGGIGLLILGTAAITATTVYLHTPAGQRSLSTFTSAAEDSISNSITGIKNFVFSKDAEAGQLQGAGREAIDRASATIEKASQDIASFKNPADVQDHIDGLQKSMDRVRDLSSQLDKTKGKTERDKIKAELKKEIDKVKGHEKDLRQKPKAPKKD